MKSNREVAETARVALGEWQDKYPTYRIAFASVAGSHSFGWSTDKSDIDVRGAYIVPTEEFFCMDNPPDTIEFKVPELNVEMQLHEIKKFVGLMIMPNMNMLDCLYTYDDLVVEKAIDEELYKMAQDSISKQCYAHIQGMTVHMRKHRNKYNMSDPKKSLYIFRELLRGIVLFETGKLINNVHDLAEELEDEEIIDEVIHLHDKKSKGEFLSEADLMITLFIERKLESRLLASKEFSPLAQRPKDDLRKRAEKFVLDIRRKSYENTL